MQSVRRVWARLRPRLAAHTQDVLRVSPDALKAAKPLYERRPPWWARFPVVLLLGDLMVMASAGELAFNKWTVEKPVEAGSNESKGVDKPSDAPASTPSGDSVQETEYVLRPVWQRFGVAGAQFVFGLGVALAILTTHARIVRQLYIFPRSALVQNKAYTSFALKVPAQTPFLLIKTANPLAPSGHVFPFGACTVKRGVDDNELELAVPGVRGQFWLGLPGAAINGEQMAPWYAREALYFARYGPKAGKKVMAEHGWEAKGPMGTR